MAEGVIYVPTNILEGHRFAWQTRITGGYGQKSSEKEGCTQAVCLHVSHIPLMYIDHHRIATNLLPLTQPNPSLLSAAV